MNKKGQALIEFVLVLPVFMLLIFAFTDLAHIALAKNYLENSLDEVSLLVHNHQEEQIANYLDNDSYQITYNIERGEYITIKLTTNIKLITPGIKRILSNPYRIDVERKVINNE